MNAQLAVLEPSVASGEAAACRMTVYGRPATFWRWLGDDLYLRVLRAEGGGRISIDHHRKASRHNGNETFGRLSGAEPKKTDVRRGCCAVFRWASLPRRFGAP